MVWRQLSLFLCVAVTVWSITRVWLTLNASYMWLSTLAAPRGKTTVCAHATSVCKVPLAMTPIHVLCCSPDTGNAPLNGAPRTNDNEAQRCRKPQRKYSVTRTSCTVQQTKMKGRLGARGCTPLFVEWLACCVCSCGPHCISHVSSSLL